MNEIAEALEQMTLILALDGIGVTVGLLAIAYTIAGRRESSRDA